MPALYADETVSGQVLMTFACSSTPLPTSETKPRWIVGKVMPHLLRREPRDPTLRIVVEYVVHGKLGCHVAECCFDSAKVGIGAARGRASAPAVKTATLPRIRASRRVLRQQQCQLLARMPQFEKLDGRGPRFESKAGVERRSRKLESKAGGEVTRRSGPWRCGPAVEKRRPASALCLARPALDPENADTLLAGSPRRPRLRSG